MTQQSGGLGELPSSLGPSDRQQQELNDAWNTYGEIEDRLSQQHIPQPMMPPAAMPTVTVEILNGLNGHQYMEVYMALDAWHSFIGETISQLENIILQINNEMDDLRAHIREGANQQARAQGAKKAADADVKHQVDINPRVRWLKLELQKNQQHLNRLEAKQKSLGRSEKLMSRNIERVKASLESSGGYGGIQRRASTPGLPPRMG